MWLSEIYRFRKCLDESRLKESLYVPEWTNKTPYLTDKGNEDTNTGCFLTITVDGVCDQNGGNNLIAGSSDTGAYDWRHIPMKRWGILNLNQKDNDADNGEQVANIAQPKSKLRRWTSIDFARTPVHPESDRAPPICSPITEPMMVPRNCRPSCCVLKWNFSPNNWGISTVIITLPKMKIMEYATAGITTQALFTKKRG